jgi:hypothetical protein
LRSSVSLRRHTTTKPRSQLHRCKMRLGNVMGRASGFRGWSGSLCLWGLRIRPLREDLLEPFPLLGYRLSYPPPQLLIDSLELCPRAVGPRLRFDQEAARAGSSADDSRRPSTVSAGVRRPRRPRRALGPFLSPASAGAPLPSPLATQSEVCSSQDVAFCAVILSSSFV